MGVALSLNPVALSLQVFTDFDLTDPSIMAPIAANATFNESDLSLQVHVDFNAREADALFFRGPPELEGTTAGLLDTYDVEVGAIAAPYIITLPGGGGGGSGASDGMHLPLGDFAFQAGAVPMSAGRYVTRVLDDLNKALADEIAAPKGASDGFALPLGDVTAEGDGSWAGGAVPLTNMTKVSDAVDKINTILGLLVPAAPPNFPNGSLSLSNLSGSSPLLAGGGVPDATAGTSGFVVGGSVNRIAATGVSSLNFNDVGPGASGTVQAILNGAVATSRTLTGADVGTYGGLVILDQKDYPVLTPGFWKSIDVSLNLLAAPIGINKVKLNHTGAGATNEVAFLRDTLSAAPTLSSLSLAQAAAGAFSYSSSVPHYGTGATLTVGASMSNLAGEAYYGGSDIFTVSGTASVISSQDFSYNVLGITTPIARNTTAARAFTPVTVAVDGAGHLSGLIQATGRNVNGTSTTVNAASTTVLIRRGAAGARIDETSVPVTGLGSTPSTANAVRVATVDGDRPAAAVAAFNSTAALQVYDAAVVAGVLQHCQTDFSAGFLPVGPNLSTGRSGAQYVVFSFNRAAVSAFKINITGSYAGCWVRLPGVSDQPGPFPNATGGWMDASKAYDGAGVPGKPGDAPAGCALGTPMSGGSGSFQITFGTESSTHATGAEMQVRLKLTPGQSVTALAFSN